MRIATLLPTTVIASLVSALTVLAVVGPPHPGGVAIDRGPSRGVPAPAATAPPPSQRVAFLAPIELGGLSLTPIVAGGPDGPDVPQMLVLDEAMPTAVVRI